MVRSSICLTSFSSTVLLNINRIFAEANFPRFAEPIPNITVTVGRDALLACVVDNLKGYKVRANELCHVQLLELTVIQKCVGFALTQFVSFSAF